MKLPIEFKTKWLAALRSGEYQQGRNALENNGFFCCLGVACKVSDTPTFSQDGDELEWIDEDSDGIPEMIGGLNNLTEQLSHMNDGYGKFKYSRKSFTEIADYIEKEL